MDRRSWPWQKKSLEKIISPFGSAEASPAHSTRHLNEQAMPTERTGWFSDEQTDQWQQPDEKIKQLKERLSVALLDASAKDLLIKQHAKVAEEAVSGWEKAEVEAQTLKEGLDSAIQQKVATQDRVSHLDDALKECMRQLRNVREEQEANIHDATMKNLRDWEKVSAELEGRLADMEQKYSTADGENKAKSQLLQEQALMITKMDEARSCAESNISALQSRLGAIEQDYTSVKMKYSKLVKESSRRPIDAAGKQHLENTRKITKLEEECLRLRGLVRTKLPASGALIQMKSEAGGSKLKNDSSRKKAGKAAAAWKLKEEDSKEPLQKTSGGGKDAEALSSHVTAMEDEAGRLKELLARRDTELQQSRLMCARTASKLSSVEEQLECLLHNMGTQKSAGLCPLDKHIEAARSFTVSCEPSLASVSEDGIDDCSDAWASALISELAHIKIEKVSSSQEAGLDGSNTQLASAIKAVQSVSSPKHDSECQEQKLVQKDEELYAGHQMYEHTGDNLQIPEVGVPILQSYNATELQLQTMQCQQNVTLQARGDGTFDQVQETSGIGCSQNGQTKKFFVNADLQLSESKFISAVSKLVEIAENLGMVVPSSELFFKSDGGTAKNRQFSGEGQLFSPVFADKCLLYEDLASALGDLVKIIAENGRLIGRNDILEAEELSVISDNARTICGSEQLLINEQNTKASNVDGNRKPIVLLKQEVTNLEGELRRVHGEKVALETHMRMEFQRFSGLQNEISQLQENKIELEHLLEAVKEELVDLRVKLQQGEQVESSYQEKLSSAEASKKLLEEQFQTYMSTKGEIESQLKAIKAENMRLQDTQGILERECTEKNEKIIKLEIKCQELSNYISQKSALVCSKCSTANGGETTQKEEEISVKLAKCQETILLLGKQLKTFTSPQSNDSSHSLINKREISCNASELRHPFEANTGTHAYKQPKTRAHAQKEMDWELQRDSNASDALDLELMNLSKFGRPLLELFGNKTPAHEHYIKAVEQLTSSSDDEFAVPKVEALTARKHHAKPALHRKKKSERSYKGVDMSKSMDNDISNEKLNTFTRFFSRGKNS